MTTAELRQLHQILAEGEQAIVGIADLAARGEVAPDVALAKVRKIFVETISPVRERLVVTIAEQEKLKADFRKSVWEGSRCVN